MNAYIDNYWEILPIERMEVLDDLTLPGQGGKNPNFKKAEEKAVKAIQKHSMDIKGRQRNPQMDEAYLLLGQARYFDQRFIPALEAFNYTINEYPDSDKINLAKIWREKTHLRLENQKDYCPRWFLCSGEASLPLAGFLARFPRDRWL